MNILLPLILIASGAGFVAAYISSGDSPPDHEPDLPPMPGSTGYKRVDAILPLLKQASSSSGIPLGLLVGWVAKESGGKLDEVTSLDERGYFQLMPDESKSLGLDHQRLSVDPVYSINGGLALIGRYMGESDSLGVAPKGSTYYYLLTKLGHSVGSGESRQLANAAKNAGQAGSWDSFEQFSRSGAVKVKHSPDKWFKFVSDVYHVGAPFGFGSGNTVISGLEGPAFTDIPDPLALLPKYRKV